MQTCSLADWRKSHLHPDRELGLTVVIAGVLIVRERREVAFWAGEASEFVTVIADTSRTLADLPQAQRRAAIEALRQQPPSIETELQRRPAPSQAFERSVLAAYRRMLERRLGAGYTVDVGLGPAPSSTWPFSLLSIKK